MLLNVINYVCLDSTNSTQELVSVAHECYTIADETSILCTNIQEKNTNMIHTSESITTEMRSFGHTNDNDNDNQKLFDGKLLHKLQDFIQQTKGKEIIEYLNDIQNDTNTIHTKVEQMNQSIQRGIQNIPSNLKNNESDGTNSSGGTVLDSDMIDTLIHPNKITNQNERGAINTVDTSTIGQEERDMIEQLMNIDTDVDELETSYQRGIGDDDNNQFFNFDLFKNGIPGSNIYELTQQKGIKCSKIVQQMRTLCTTIINLMQSLLNNNCCCIQTFTILSNIGNLFRCQNIIQLLIKAIDMIQRMIQKMIQVVQKVYVFIQKIIQKIVAGKKINQFMKQIIPNKRNNNNNTNDDTTNEDGNNNGNGIGGGDCGGGIVGQVATNIVSNIFK